MDTAPEPTTAQRRAAAHLRQQLRAIVRDADGAAGALSRELEDAGRAAAARDIADPHGRMSRSERTTTARHDGTLRTTRTPFPGGEARRAKR